MEFERRLCVSPSKFPKDITVRNVQEFETVDLLFYYIVK